jgi:DNA-binding beta-propeller fold protein YncE
MTQFSHQDQIGLYVELLDQRLRMSFAVRVFDADTGRLVKDARSDAVHRFPGKLVWYHEGVEPPGRYRAELLYSDDTGGMADVLTHVFEYGVGTTPVPIPTLMPIASPTSLAVPTPMPIPMAVPPPVSEPSNPTVRLAVATPPPVAVQPTSTPRPLPTSVSATTLFVIAGPAALDVVEPLDQLIIADRSGLVWSLDHGQPALKRPFSVSGDPVGLAADAANNRLYVAVRAQPAVVTVDATSGKQLASTPLSGDPGDVRLDPGLGLLHVLVPERDLLETIDVATFKVVRSTPGLAQVTGISLDLETHAVYLSHLGGQLSVVEGQTGSVLRRVGLSAEGLAGVVAAHGRVFGINTPARELLEVDPSMTGVSHLALAAEPVCIVVGPQTGLVYVLDAASNAIVRIDPATGAELGRVQVADDGAAISSQLLPDALWLRPRMVVSSADERVYLIEPDGATLALLPSQL